MLTNVFSKNEDFFFWKNLFLGAIFFTMAPLTIGVSLFSLYSLQKTTHKPNVDTGALSVFTNTGVRIYASLPDTTPSVEENFHVSDARTQIVRQYLERYNSPLLPYADFLVSTADKYSLDFRLLTAIAQQESNLCKIIPPESHNCWGWGIHSRGSLGFDTYEHAIETVSQGLKSEYIDKGYTTVEKIMSKYTPMSNGSWARGVNQFLADMQ